jgi:hypothetical protein
MKGKKSISNISHRSNIIHRLSSENEVVIFEDHRTILNVLFHLMDVRGISKPLDIIMFDYHDDFCDPSIEAIKRVHKFIKKPEKETLYNIVEFYLSHLDDDWVKAGMELGIIGNVFLFNSKQTSVSFREEYKTKNYGKRYFYNVGDVWDALGHRGILNDPIKVQYKQFWDDFGWELVNGKFKFKDNRNKFILDIDIDCFSTRVFNRTIAIPNQVILPLLTEQSKPEYHYYYSSQQFIKDLISQSELVTICFETECCGGINQAFEIFNMLDDVLFNNELGV